MLCKDNDFKGIKKTIRNCHEIIYAHYKKVL